jgi:hypothetical protein
VRSNAHSYRKQNRSVAAVGECLGAAVGGATIARITMRRG